MRYERGPSPDGELVPIEESERDPSDPLHICSNEECGSNLIYPIEWDVVPSDCDDILDNNWEVLLRCPECEHYEICIADQDTVDELDYQLDLGTETAVRDLYRLIHKNMEEEIDRFTKALNANNILPEDF